MNHGRYANNAEKIHDLLRLHHDDLVLVSFTDAACHDCIRVHHILRNISKIYQIQMDILSPEPLENYMTIHTLHAKQAFLRTPFMKCPRLQALLLIPHLKDPGLRNKLLSQGNIPVYADDKKRNYLFPVANHIRTIKDDCTGLLAAGLLLLLAK